MGSDRLVVRIPEDGPYRVTFSIMTDDGGTWRERAGSPARTLGGLPQVALDSAEGHQVDRNALGAELLTWLAVVEPPEPQTPHRTCDPTWRAALGDGATAGVVGDICFDIGPPELRRLPWELMCDATARDWSFQSRRPIAYRRRATSADRPGATRFRILVVLATAPDEHFWAELWAVNRGLASTPCLWDVSYLIRPTMDEFAAQCREKNPDILHIIGHGDVTTPLQRITIEPDGPSWVFDKTYVHESLLHRRRTPPGLVVLGFCTASDAEHDLVDALLVAGSGAVVSMQGRVGTVATNLFTEEFYRGLAEGGPVHEAVARARGDVRDWDSRNPESADRTAFARPMLTCSVDPRELHFRLPINDDSRHPARQIDRVNGFSRTHLVVDRSDERRRITERMVSAPQSLTYVVGEDWADMSNVVRACVVTARAQGRWVVYLDLSSGTDDPRIWGAEEFVGALRYGVEHETRLFSQVTPSSPDSNPPSLDTHAQRMARPSPDEQLYADLRQFLADFAPPDDVVIVVDGAHTIGNRIAFQQQVLRHLCTGRIPRFGLVLVEQVVVGRRVSQPYADYSAVVTIAGGLPPTQAVELTLELTAKDGPPDCITSADHEPWRAYRKDLRTWAVKTVERDPSAFTARELEAEYTFLRNANNLPWIAEPVRVGVPPR